MTEPAPSPRGIASALLLALALGAPALAQHELDAETWIEMRKNFRQEGPAPTIEEDLASLPAVRPRRYTWPELMRRVFAVDVLECPRCRGRMRILAEIHPPGPTTKILEHLGLPPRAPPPVPSPAEMMLDTQDPDSLDF